MLRKRQRAVVHLLWLSSGTLAAYQNNESDRINLCNDKASVKANKRVWVKSSNALDDLQVIDVSRISLEKAARKSKDYQGHERSSVQRWRRGRNCGLKVKRKWGYAQYWNTTFDNISKNLNEGKMGALMINPQKKWSLRQGINSTLSSIGQTYKASSFFGVLGHEAD